MGAERERIAGFGRLEDGLLILPGPRPRFRLAAAVGQCHERGDDSRAPSEPGNRTVGSLEVRWIFPGQLEAAVARWFGRFPAGRSPAKTPTCWIRSCAGCR